MITPALAKVALASVTDKPSNLRESAQKLLFFACAAIQFGVPEWVTRGDSETIFQHMAPKIAWGHLHPLCQEEEELGGPKVGAFMALI